MGDVPRRATTGAPAAPVPRVRLLPLALVWTVGLAALTGVLASGWLSPASELVLGNTGVAIAMLVSAGACLRRAGRRTNASRSWVWLGVALAMRALGHLLRTLPALTGGRWDLDPLPDAIGYFGYNLPAAVALLLFPKRPDRWISRFRSVVDAAVIAFAVVLIPTVLLRLQTGTDAPAVGPAYAGVLFPMIDLGTCALVLTLGLRQPPANRLVWLWLGAGLVSSAVTDSVYGVMRTEGAQNLTGTPLVAGWVIAAALVGLASVVPTPLDRRGWDLALWERLLPYVPVLAATIILGATSSSWRPAELAVSILLLLLLSVRQVMIAYENLELTRDLESKVAARTSELATVASIVESSTDAIVGISAANTVTAWNPAAERLYGIPATEVLGRTPDFLSPEDAIAVRALLASARRGETLSHHEIDWRRPDGTVVPVALTVSPVLVADVVQGISVISQDITERRRTAETLERAREDALASSRLKSEFLATMSHEIRTPMNGVIGLTSLLIETDLDALQRKYAEGVRSAGQSLIDVINDILDFSKLEAGRVVIKDGDFDLPRLADEVGDLMAPAAAAKGLELCVSYPSDAPVAVRGDRVRIRQILLNLVSNGIKFTTVGRVTVRIEAQALDAGRVRLRVEVADTGIGVAQADRPRLFDSFTQADASTTRRFGGTGLGLAISRRLVEVMGGTIGLHSELGVGTTFWFELPLAAGGPGTEPPRTSEHDLLTGRRVLVVDDNATGRSTLHAQLTSWRMQADLIDDASVAVARLHAAEAQGAAYDLAVLDLTGPGTDGPQVARQVAAEPSLVGLPVLVLVSAPPLPTEAPAAAGGNEQLAKPVSSSELYDRLVRLFAPGDVAEPAGPIPDTAVVPGDAGAVAGPEAGPTPQGRILVVEDNALNRLVAAGLVARLGYQVDAVDDGGQALVALDTGSYAAVLMDCHMPGMDGFAATREIRRRQSGTDRTPVIALTAGALAADRERCMAAGMDDYIAKPVDLDALETVLGRWVGPREPAGTDGGLPSQPTTTDESPIDWARVGVLQEFSAPDGTSLMHTFLETFRSRGVNRLAAIREASQGGDAHGLTLAAHELKGSAGTLGAVRVAAICGVLERAGRDGAAVAPELLDELDLEFDHASTALATSCDPLRPTSASTAGQ